jgi:hypothetical protein
MAHGLSRAAAREYKGKGDVPVHGQVFDRRLPTGLTLESQTHEFSLLTVVAQIGSSPTAMTARSAKPQTPLYCSSVTISRLRNSA